MHDLRNVLEETGRPSFDQSQKNVILAVFQ